MRSRIPFVGRLDAAAFLIDPRSVGSDEAAQRVLRAWVPGARLVAYGDRWLLVLPAPISVRAERAPGLPVREQGGRLVILDGGREVDVAAADLPEVDLADLLDLDGFELRRLRAVTGQRPPDPLPPESVVRPAPPALRRRAGVGAADTGLARSGARLAAEGARPGGPRRGSSGTWARLVARSPAAPVVGRRHARYVDRLSRSFERRDWDQALRGAISLGGAGGSALTLRLPQPRRGALRPAATRPGGGAVVGFGPTVHEHLRQLYTQAAQQLEQEGEYLLAAFVWADLVGQVPMAVDLLERHQRYAEAAELAEGRHLDPAYAVRLWWRAGDRERALRVAVARGAFADALARLGKDDAAAALELRRAWVVDRRAAGDHLGAVIAAWPEPALRDEVVADLAVVMAAGGAGAGRALAHLLEHRPDDRAVELGRRLLVPDEDTALDAARGAFVSALSMHPVDRPAADRELTSLALLALLRGDARVDDPFTDLVLRLRKRADQVLVADLPRIVPPTATVDDPSEVDLTTPGALSVYDAVALGPTSVLVALGELGVRLLTRDGRVKQRWDVPTHRLVVADHGQRVLLVTDRHGRFLVHQLDLADGRPRPLPPLDVAPLPSYDGARPVLVSQRGIEWVEPAGDRWRLVWRELTDPRQTVYQAVRTEDSLAALLTQHDGINVWRWVLPSVRLQTRSVVEHDQHLAVVATGELARMRQNAGVATLDWHHPSGHRLTTETTYPSGEQRLLVSGSAFAVVDDADRGCSVEVHPGPQAPMSSRVHVPPGSRAFLRAWRDLVVVGHERGRLAVIDTGRNQVVANLTLQA